MGNIEFLTGSSGSTIESLVEAIEKLQDASVVFIARWASGDIRRADLVSNQAMECFDHIISELMRHRDDRVGRKVYASSQFEAEMQKLLGSMISPASTVEHQGVVAAGPGNGRLPASRGTPNTISFEKTLNKVKHRDPKHINFRIDGGKHIFILCPVKIGGGPDSIVEFDVQEFCAQSRNAAAAL